LYTPKNYPEPSSFAKSQDTPFPTLYKAELSSVLDERKVQQQSLFSPAPKCCEGHRTDVLGNVWNPYTIRNSLSY